MKITTPMIATSIHVNLIASSISSGVLLGPKESKISPIKKTKEGIPSPAIAASSKPSVIKHLSDPDPMAYSLEYFTLY